MMWWFVNRGIFFWALGYLLDFLALAFVATVLFLDNFLKLKEGLEKDTILPKSIGYLLVALIAAIPAFIVANMISTTVTYSTLDEPALIYVIGPLFVIESLWSKPKSAEELPVKIIGTGIGIAIYFLAYHYSDTFNLGLFETIGKWLAYQ